MPGATTPVRTFPPEPRAQKKVGENPRGPAEPERSGPSLAERQSTSDPIALWRRKGCDPGEFGHPGGGQSRSHTSPVRTSMGDSLLYTHLLSKRPVAEMAPPATGPTSRGEGSGSASAPGPPGRSSSGR